MAGRSSDPAEIREKFVNAWNNTLIDIWKDRIYRLKPKVVDTGNLYRSLKFNNPEDVQDRYTGFTLKEKFLEYGLWVDLGVGRNTAIGNTHRKDMDGFVNKRERRKWYSSKYFSSTMRIRDFMSESLGQEFVGMVATLDPEKIRKETDYYKRKGLS